MLHYVVCVVNCIISSRNKWKLAAGQLSRVRETLKRMTSIMYTVEAITATENHSGWSKTCLLAGKRSTFPVFVSATQFSRNRRSDGIRKPIITGFPWYFNLIQKSLCETAARSPTVLTPGSLWLVRSETNGGAFVDFRKVMFGIACSLLQFDIFADPQSCIPYVRTNFRI